MRRMSRESAFLARSQNRLTRVRTAYATQVGEFIWSMGTWSAAARADSTWNLTPDSSVKTRPPRSSAVRAETQSSFTVPGANAKVWVRERRAVCWWVKHAESDELYGR